MNTTMFLGGAAAGLLVAAILVQVSDQGATKVLPNPVSASNARHDAAAIRRLEAENAVLRDMVVHLNQIVAKDSLHATPSSSSRVPAATKKGDGKQGGSTEPSGTGRTSGTRGTSDAASSQSIRIDIVPGMSITEVADELAKAHVIDHADVFVRLAEMGPYIRAGTYTLPVNGDPVSVLRTLTTP